MIKRIFIPVAACMVLTACKPPATGVSITGYNHMKRIPVAGFTVNGAGGPDVGAESGGGKETCCVIIPDRWRPGLKMKISWAHDKYQDDPNPVLPSQTVEVDVPEYRKVGVVQVQFYDAHRVKVVVSNCGAGHAFNPMSKEDMLPWEPRETKEEAIAAAKRGGRKNDC